MTAEQLRAAAPSAPGRARRLLKGVGLQAALLVAALAASELALRAIAPDSLYLSSSARPGSFMVQWYDAELGWAPIANTAGKVHATRTFEVRINSLGMRDIEPDASGRPTLLFLGDSYVWGFDAEANERFSDLLRPQLPAYQVLAAGVTGYGTDQ
jgi:hypothetical protein